jgi:LysM repeat protein
LVCLAAGSVQATDTGPRHQAEGPFAAATGTYVVVRDDDLDAIAQRFGVTLEELMKGNKLRSTVIEVGQKLVAATKTEGSPAAVLPGASTRRFR